MTSLYIPSFDEIIDVAQCRGDNSEAPELWTGLAGLWPFAAGGGLKAFDVSGYGSHGTLTNMDPATDWVMTEMGRALDFLSSSSQYVSLPLGDQPVLLSVAGWANVTGEDDDFPAIWSQNNDAASRGAMLTYFKDDNTFHFYVYDGGWQLAKTAVVSLNTWYHVCGVYDGTNVLIYLDGKLGPTTGAATTIDWGPATVQYIGRYSAGYFFLGRIAGVQRWSRALTPSEIQLLFTRPHAMVTPRQEVFPAAVAPVAGFARALVSGSLAHGRTSLVG